MFMTKTVLIVVAIGLVVHLYTAESLPTDEDQIPGILAEEDQHHGMLAEEDQLPGGVEKEDDEYPGWRF